MTLCAHSQSSKTSDSTCLPNYQLKLALKKIEQGEMLKKQCEQLMERYENESRLLNKRIDDRDSIVSYLREKEAISNEVKASMARQINAAQAQIDIYAKEVRTIQKSLKKSKTKTFLTALAGVVVSAVLILK